MKLGPVTNLTRETRQRQKKLMMTSSQQILTSWSFCQFMANLQPSESRIPHAQPIKLAFSLKITFCLTNHKNKTKKSLTQLSYYCFELRYYFCQKMPLIFLKNAGISKIKGALVLKDIFYETKYVFVLTHQISSFYIILMGFRLWGTP